MIKIYHNSNCSKSCKALAKLEEKNLEVEVIDYLTEIPSVEELKQITLKLQCRPHELIRTNEAVYINHFKDKELSDEEWLAAMHNNPILIQRPIIVNGDNALIARSSDVLEKILGN